MTTDICTDSNHSSTLHHFPLKEERNNTYSKHSKHKGDTMMGT